MGTVGKTTRSQELPSGAGDKGPPKRDSVPRLDLTPTKTFEDNAAKLRASIDAQLEREDVAAKLGAKLRPLVRQALESPADGRKPIAVRVSSGGTEYFSSESLTGGVKHGADHSLSAILGNVVEGLLAGLVAAGLDYLRFNQAMQQGNVPEYRPEQIGTQAEVFTTAAELGGTGASLAFAAFQWCFTNDLLFYAYAYADDSKETGWNDTRAGVKKLARGEQTITWASWSLLGVLTGSGTEDNPMTFGQAVFQGFVLGPLLALALSAAAQELELQNLVGSLLSLSLQTELDKEVDEVSIVQALALRLGLTPDQSAAFVAKVFPMVIGGSVQGTRVSGTVQITDELVSVCLGIGIGVRGAGKTAEGKTLGHATMLTMPMSFAYKDKTFSATVTAQVPLSTTWRDGDKKPLPIETQKELHVDDPQYSRDLETLELGVKLGKLDLQVELRNSFQLQQLLVGAGFQYHAGNLTLSGQAWLLTGVRKRDVGFELRLGVRLP